MVRQMRQDSGDLFAPRRLGDLVELVKEHHGIHAPRLHDKSNNATPRRTDVRVGMAYVWTKSIYLTV